MLVVKSPSSVDVTQLVAELAAAGLLAQVALTERTVGNLHIDGHRPDGTPLGEADIAEVTRIVRAHRPSPPPIDQVDTSRVRDPDVRAVLDALTSIIRARR